MENKNNHSVDLLKELEIARKQLETVNEKGIYIQIGLWRSCVKLVQIKSHLLGQGLLGLDYSKQILITNLINEVEEFIASYLQSKPVDKVDIRIKQICFESKLDAYIEELNTML